MTRLAFPPSDPARISPGHALAQGVSLSALYGMHLSPTDVARVLTRANVRYVLVGAHAINLYTGKPRATRDVDVVTDAPAKALRAVQHAYPHFTVEVHPVVIRFKDNGEEVLDLIKAGSGKIFRRVMRLVTRIEVGGVSVVVPTIEAALALKFCSMVNPTRPTDDRMQDAVDFSRAAKSHEKIDRPLLHELGELVYVGGGEALVRLIEDAVAGRRLEL